jgi:hypothetical protein
VKAILVLTISFYALFRLFNNHDFKIASHEDIDRPNKERAKPSRSIASVTPQKNLPSPFRPQRNNPGPGYRQVENSSFGNRAADAAESPEDSSGGSADSAVTQSEAPSNSISPYAPSYNRGVASSSSSSNTTAPNFSKTPTAASTTSTGFSSGSIGSASYGALVSKPATTTASTGSTTGTTTTPTTPVVATLDCTANQGAGTYKNPITLSLSCSNASAITYCIQENTCCDPASTPTVYSAPIPLGDEAKTYCVTFMGRNTSTTSTKISQTYTFNPDSPHLITEYLKSNYQTTQLNGSMKLASSDFGSVDFLVGQINLGSHDPGVLGLNLSCENIVSNYTTMTTPAPVQTIVPIHMDTLAPLSHLEIFMTLPKLFYGNNFITSYAVHVNYPEKITCSTKQVVLNDFEYFQHDLNFDEAGLTGTLTPYGFFETDAQLYRGPAGVSEEDQSGQELRQGLFAIFFL